MIRLLTSFSVCLCLTTLAWGQGARPAAGGNAAQPAAATTAPAAVPHKVGLIDMNHVFKNYKKFQAMKDSLQAEAEQVDAQMKQTVEKIKTQQGVLTSGNLKEGSPEFAKAEQQLLEMQSGLQALQRKTQRDFLQKEADMYKTVYLEVEDLVSKYARHFQYTLVMRFNRTDVEHAENPRDIVTGMNRQVVYHRAEDDLTDAILEYLNKDWEAKQRSASRP